MDGQVPRDRVIPPTPKGLAMPFRYGSLQSMWLYWLIDPRLVDERLPDLPAGEGLATARFGCDDDIDRALVSIDLQRYTALAATMLETTEEVELNLHVYPAAAAGRVPQLHWREYLAGGDETRTIGGYRLHVPCSNPFAVHAGQELFGEPKFVAAFDYEVPAPNAPAPRSWTYTVRLPGPGWEPAPPGGISPPPTAGGPTIFSVAADIGRVPTHDLDPSPLIEYGVLASDGPPRVVANWWSFHGPFRTSFLEAESPASVTVTVGDADHPMGRDLATLVGDARPCAAQVFESPVVSVEDGGWFPVPK